MERGRRALPREGYPWDIQVILCPTVIAAVKPCDSYTGRTTTPDDPFWHIPLTP